MTTLRPVRRAYSLIELLTVIACLAIVMTITAGLMIQMLRLDRGGRDRAVAASNLERLATALRADAHAATAPVETKADRLVLPVSGGRTIEYLVRGVNVVRTIREGEKVRGFEAYPRPKGTTARFGESITSDATMVSLHVETPPGRNVDPLYHGYRIDAETGRYARLRREVAR